MTKQVRVNITGYATVDIEDCGDELTPEQARSAAEAALCGAELHAIVLDDIPFSIHLFLEE